MSTNFEAMPKFEQFIRERQLLHNVSTATAEWHRQSLAWLKVSSPTQEDLNDFVCKMREHGLAVSSVNNRIRSVNAYLHWLATGTGSGTGTDGKCGSGCRHLRCTKLKEPQNVVPTYTPEQIRVLIQWKPAHKNFYHRRLHLLILTLLDCGLRISEALTLHVRDVSMDDLLLLVIGKGSKQRRVPFSFELRKRLYKFVSDFQLAPDTLLFCTAAHTMLDKDIVRRDVRLLCRSLGFEPPKSVLHSFRHTFGTNYVRKGGDVFRLQKVLGHSSLSTSRIYANLNTADLSAVHERLSLLAS